MNVPWSSLILFLHVLSAMVLVGSSLVAPLVLAALRSAGTVEELRGWLALGRRSGRLNPAAALALLATGVYCGRHGWWGAGWFWVAVGVWALNMLLAARVVRPAAGRLAVAAFAAPPGPVSPDVDALRRLAGFAHAQRAMLVNDLTVLFFMLDKPSLSECLVILVAANAVALAAARLRERASRSRVGSASPSLRTAAAD